MTMRARDEIILSLVDEGLTYKAVATYCNTPIGAVAGVIRRFGAVPSTLDWQDHTRRNLAWTYGSARADRIMAGKDAKTNRDLDRWNRLGRRA